MKFRQVDIDGITLLYEKSRMCKGVSFCIVAEGGSSQDSIPGISHFYEHMLFNGTNEHTGEELGKLIRKYNCRQNASTGRSCIKVYSVNSAKNFEKNFAICSEMFFDSNFPKDKIKKEKGVVNQEINRYLDRNEAVCFQQIFNKIYSYPEYKHHTLGTPESLNKITQKHLQDLQKRISVRENIVVSVAGNVSLCKCKKLVKKYIADVLPSGQSQKPDIFDLTINGRPQLVLLTKPTFKTCINVCIKKDGCENKKINYYNNVLGSVLNRLKGRLYNTFREENSLVYSTRFERVCNRKDGFDCYEIYTSKDKVNECIDALAKLLKDLQKNGITKEEWEDFKSGEKVKEDTNVEIYEDWAHENYDKYSMWKDAWKKREKMYKKYKKIVCYEEVNDYIKNTILSDEIWISIVGDVSKKDIYSYKKMCDVLTK